MFDDYWPTTDKLRRFMDIEAENRAEHQLLAVHEPMKLRSEIQQVSTSGQDEHALLQTLIKADYLIPILGDAGSGKSHLICWLEAKLKVHPACGNWHIKRIPKNASLRGVLSTLLEGLDGDEFDEVRKQIEFVGDNLKVEKVADELLLAFTHALNDLRDEMDMIIENISDGRQIATTTIKQRKKIIDRHIGGDSGLQSLLQDPNFKGRLVAKERCIHRLATRFTRGSTHAELASADYEDYISPDDLDLKKDFEISKLSFYAQDYIGQASLDSMDERMQEAVDLLNEVLPKIMSKVFQQYYTFAAVGSFSDLFQDVRRYLKARNKVLVILVEDLACISAIKETLIENLTQSGVYDGEEQLCPLRSVCAVTTGSYFGGASASIGWSSYAPLQDTVKTRTGEWFIEDTNSDQDATLARIEDFCGRYLNAARIGSQVLKDTYDPSAQDGQWPQKYYSKDPDAASSVEEFGVSSKGYPLFPFNKASIKALVERDGEIKFDPRRIVRMLKDVLTARDLYIQSEFPPQTINHRELGMRGDLEAELRNELKVSRIDTKTKTFVAIWGYGANDMHHLSRLIKPKLATAFGLGNVGDILNATMPSSNAVDSNIKKPESLILEPKPKPNDQQGDNRGPSFSDTLSDISTDVDKWFKDKSIPQSDANKLRKVLISALKSKWDSGYAKWLGCDKPFPKYLSVARTPIHVTYNSNNPDGCILSFGNRTDFGDDEVIPKGFYTALLRFNDLNVEWDYDGGDTDRHRYINYLDSWVLEAIKVLAEKERSDGATNLGTHIKKLNVLFPSFMKKTYAEKLEILCQGSDALEAQNTETGIKSFDELKLKARTEWHELQSQWLTSFMPAKEKYAIDGFLLKKALKRYDAVDHDSGRDVRRGIVNAVKEIKGKYKDFSMIAGCETAEDFKKHLHYLSEMVDAIHAASLWEKTSDQSKSATQVKNLINRVLEANLWATTKAILNLQAPGDPILESKNLNNVDGAKADQLLELLDTSNSIFKTHTPKLQRLNAELATDKRLELKADIDNKIAACCAVLSETEGMFK